MYIRFQRDRLDLFWQFICERQCIWHGRFVQKLPPPWTQDQIMQSERFTNIYRELDPGTQYVIQEILEKEAPKPDKIFNTMLYRLIGRSESHKALGFQWLAVFDPAQLERVLKEIREKGEPPFTGAYMVSAYTSMGSKDKVENVVRLFALLDQSFGNFYGRIERSSSPAEVYEVLRSAHGFGNFLAYQVLVDLLYPLRVYGNVPLLPYSHNDWASPGPGALRGIKMLLQEDVDVEPLEVMCWLRQHQHEEFQRLGLDFPFLSDENDRVQDISLANIQNCLCEFHKYIKISEGTGRGRR
ncbi:MAG: nucleotide kinase domain-containing protein, partial [Ktedonobacteraceae bacterium]